MQSAEFVATLLKRPSIREHYRVDHYAKNEIIESRGTLITHVGIVRAGYLNATNYTREGKEMGGTVFAPDSIVLEYLYLSGDRCYTYNLVALSKARVVWIPAAIFRQTIFSDSHLEQQYICLLAQRGLENQRMLACLAYKTIRERLAYWIVSDHQVEKTQRVTFPVSQEAFAEILQVTRPSLNQTLHQMADAGYFKMQHNVLTAIDREALLALI